MGAVPEDLSGIDTGSLRLNLVHVRVSKWQDNETIESKWGSPYKVILSPSDQMVRVIQGGTKVGESRVDQVSLRWDQGWSEVDQGSLRLGLDLVEFWDMTSVLPTQIPFPFTSFSFPRMLVSLALR